MSKPKCEATKDMSRRSDIPFGAWPRGLNWNQFAAYRGVSVNKLKAEVKAGLWSEPEISGGRQIFDRRRIDERWDQLVAEGEGDPLMEALNDREA